MNERIVAAILAGGQGERIGGDKALKSLGGSLLIAHVARALSNASALAVVGDFEAAQILGATALSDPTDLPRGPLAGVLSALEWGAAGGVEWVAFAPCDTPLLPGDIIERLRAAADGALACAETEDGLEPLISLWRTSLAARVRASLNTGAHPPMHVFFREIGVARVSLSATEAMNVNTLDDLARAETILAKR